MTNKQLQDMSDFFIRTHFKIPTIKTRFSKLNPNTLGTFVMTENDSFDLKEEDPELFGQIENAPEYRTRSCRENGFGFDILPDPVWTDPLNKPHLDIYINTCIQKKNKTLPYSNDQMIAGVLLHELTHYYCWYCGYDHHDGSREFEKKLLELGLPSNYYDQEYNKTAGGWYDAFDYSTMQRYLDEFHAYEKDKTEEYCALVIKKKWLDLILSGEKTLEIRGCDCKKRGMILLAESGRNSIVGCCTLSDSTKLNEYTFGASKDHHKVCDIPYTSLPYQSVYAWHLKNAKRFSEPIPFKYPKGAIRWIRIASTPGLKAQIKENYEQNIEDP